MVVGYIVPSIMGATEKVRSRSVIGVTGSVEKRVFYQSWRGVRVLQASVKGLGDDIVHTRQDGGVKRLLKEG